MAQRKFSTTWNGVPIKVTSRIVSRYAWTTASIDVCVNESTVLRTAGVMKIYGDTVATFEHQGISHTAVLSWGKGALRSFPFRLEIDGILVADSRVPVQNWWTTFWPLTATLLLATVWHLLSSI